MKARRESARGVEDARRAGQASSTKARMPKGRGAKSELHQRIRAARMYANKTQDAIAEALVPAISRAAVAYWEAVDPEKRSLPSPTQLMQVAKMCRVPIEWLMDDSQSVDGLYAYMQEQERRLSAGTQPLDARHEAGQRAFWSAVEHTVLGENIKLSGRFNVPVRQGGVELVAGFWNGKTLAGFVNVRSDWKHDVARECGQLLLVEKLIGRPHAKALIVFVQAELPEQREAAEYGRALDIDVRTVSTVEQAARVLLRL